MSQTLEAGLGTPATDTVAAPSRSRRRPWLISLALVLLVALCAGLGWIMTFQPIALAGGQIGIMTLGTTEVRTINNAYGMDARIIQPKPGDSFEIFVGVRNTGPLGVTIDELGQPFNLSGVVGDGSQPDETSAGRTAVATDPASVDFRDAPVTLAPGEYGQLRVSFDILECATVEGLRGGVSSVTTLRLTYRTLGVSREVELDPGFAVSVEAMPHCP